MDAEVKKRFDELCKDFGMSANTAFSMFARTVIKQERMRASAIANGIADMPMEEIDEEIRQYIEERRVKRF